MDIYDIKVITNRRPRVIGGVPLSIPAGFCLPHVDMSKRAVYADTAFIGEQGFGVCGYLFRWNACNLNICCFAVLVLGECRSADVLVVRWCAVGRCDCHRLAEMRADFLQDAHKLGIYKYGI